MEWGKSEKFIIVDGGDRTQDPKTHDLSTTPFDKDFSGVLVRLTTCNWLTDSLPKLSLITVSCCYWKIGQNVRRVKAYFDRCILIFG